MPVLAGMVQLHPADLDALRQYVEAVAIWNRAVLELDGAPLVVETAHGAQQMNPLLRVKSQAEALMTKLSERFGLDPASRKRLALAAVGAAAVDSMADFLANRPARSPVPFVNE